MIREIFRKKGRVLMTIIAVMAAMSLLLSMLSIAEGIRVNAVKDIEEGKVDVYVNPYGDYALYNAHEVFRNISGWDGVKGASLTLSVFGSFMPVANISGNVVPVGCVGILPRYEMQMMSDDDMERFHGYFNDTEDFYDDPHYANGTYSGPFTGEIIVGDNLLKDFNLSVGDTIHIMGAIGEQEREFRIVGYYDTGLTGGGAIGSLKIYGALMRLSELQEIVAYRDIKERDRASSISISLDPKTPTENFLAKFERAYPEYSEDVKTRSEMVADAEQYSAVSTVFYQAIGSIALIISLLFVASVMIMSVYERTNEIGMMRAIGISRKTIFLEILGEGLVLVVMGALLGLIPGYFGSIALGNYISSSIGIKESMTAFTPEMIMNALMEVIVLGSLFTLYPAWKASRMNILEALKYTG